LWAKQSEQTLTGFVNLKDCIIAVTGASKAQRIEVEELAGRYGASYTTALTPENTHLVNFADANAKSAKRSFAEEHDIEVVGQEWLTQMIELADSAALRSQNDVSRVPLQELGEHYENGAIVDSDGGETRKLKRLRRSSNDGQLPDTSQDHMHMDEPPQGGHATSLERTRAPHAAADFFTRQQKNVVSPVLIGDDRNEMVEDVEEENPMEVITMTP